MQGSFLQGHGCAASASPVCASVSSYLECCIKYSQRYYGHCCPWCSHHNHQVDLQQVEQESQHRLQLVRDDRINSIHVLREAVQQVSNGCLLKEEHWASHDIAQQLQEELVWGQDTPQQHCYCAGKPAKGCKRKEIITSRSEQTHLGVLFCKMVIST